LRVIPSYLAFRELIGCVFRKYNKKFQKYFFESWVRFFLQNFGGWWLNLASTVATVTHQKKWSKFGIFHRKKFFRQKLLFFLETYLISSLSAKYERIAPKTDQVSLGFRSIFLRFCMDFDYFPMVWIVKIKLIAIFLFLKFLFPKNLGLIRYIFD